MIHYKCSKYDIKIDENKGVVSSLKIGDKEYVDTKKMPVFLFQIYNEDMMVNIQVDSTSGKLTNTQKKGNDYVFTYGEFQIESLQVKVYVSFDDEIKWDIDVNVGDPFYVEWIDFPRIAAPNAVNAGFGSKTIWNVDGFTSKNTMSHHKLLEGQHTSFDFSKIPSFKDVHKDFFKVGVAVEPRDLIFYKDLVTSQFNELCSENRMKCANIHPEEDTYCFTGMDKLVNFAEENNMTIRGHGLVYEKTLCPWMFKNPDGSRASKELVLERLEKHIKTIVGKYKGRIYSYDVVNELFGHVDWDTRELTAICGIGWVPLAFKWAHEADPDAILIVNDNYYDIPQKRENIYKWVKKWIDEGAPIHGIGFQDHHYIDTSLEAIDETFKLFSSIPDFKIYVTELDINSYVFEDLTSRYPDYMIDEVLELSARKYASLFDIYRKYADHIETITLWNVCDARTWYDEWYLKGRKHYALPFGYEGDPMPSFWSAIDVEGKLPRWEKTTKPLYIRNNNYTIDADKDILTVKGTTKREWGTVKAELYTYFGEKKLLKSQDADIQRDFQFDFKIDTDKLYDGTVSPDYILEVTDDVGNVTVDLITYYTKAQREKYYTVTDNFYNLEKTCCYINCLISNLKGDFDGHTNYVKPLWFWGNGVFGDGEIEYEIPAGFDFDRFEVEMYTENSKYFEISASNDGKNYTVVDAKWKELETNSAKQRVKGVVGSVPQDTKYIKINLNKGFADYWHSYEARLVGANLYTNKK